MFESTNKKVLSVLQNYLFSEYNKKTRSEIASDLFFNCPDISGVKFSHEKSGDLITEIAFLDNDVTYRVRIGSCRIVLEGM